MKIGIISDIHEDIYSLKETIDSLEKFNCTEIICLGDITGYDRVFYSNISKQDASECVRIIRGNCKYSVAGNHDLHSVKKIPDVFKQMNLPGNWYQIDQSERKKLYGKLVWLYDNDVNENLNEADREYLSSLPEYLVLRFCEKNFFFSHSAYPDFTGSIVHRPYNAWDLHKHFQFIKSHDCSTGFSGHMHPQGILKINLNTIKLLSFGIHIIRNEFAQFFNPCLADSGNKKGFSVLDPAAMSIEVVRIKSKNKKWFMFYERIHKKY